MSSHKPFIPPPEPLNKSKDHYRIQGEPYKHLEIEINLISFKTIGAAILLGLPYVGLIVMIDSLGLRFLTAILIGTGILIGGVLGLLYYLNRQEPVKPPANQNKRR